MHLFGDFDTLSNSVRIRALPAWYEFGESSAVGRRFRTHVLVEIVKTRPYGVLRDVATAGDSRSQGLLTRGTNFLDRVFYLATHHILFFSSGTHEPPLVLFISSRNVTRLPPA